MPPEAFPLGHGIGQGLLHVGVAGMAVSFNKKLGKTTGPPKPDEVRQALFHAYGTESHTVYVNKHEVKALAVFAPKHVSWGKILVQDVLFVHGSCKVAQCLSCIFVGSFGV